MDNVESFIELGKLVPALGVLVWLVFGFLRHLEKREDKHARHLEDTQKRSEQVIDRNTQAFDRVMIELHRRDSA